MLKDIKICIRNFGPIQGPETIALNRFMVFSGNSGLGKSYLALLVHYTYKIISGEELVRYFREKEFDYSYLIANRQADGTILEIDVAEFSTWINNHAITYMRNMLGNLDFTADIRIDLPGLPKRFIFRYDTSRLSLNQDNRGLDLEILRLDGVEQPLQIPGSIIGDSGPYPFVFLIHNYFNELYSSTINHTLLLPPSRGALVSLNDDTTMRLSQSMGMYNEFLSDMATLKSLKPQGVSDVAASACEIARSKLLQGDIDLRDGDLVYTSTNLQKPLPISATASSIKELSPFILMMKKGILPDVSTLFEEPEAHLHPEMQMRVADMLACAVNAGTHLQITTHSDYMLRRLNDLIRLYRIKEEFDNAAKFEEFCTKLGFTDSVVLDPAKVSAYYLYHDNGSSAVKIRHQSVDNGIPFDTFDSVTANGVTNSLRLLDEFDTIDFTRN